MSSMYNIVGKKFNRLTVLEKTRINKQYTPYWLCLCECGNKKEIRGDQLKSGHSKSCGCLLREVAKKQQEIMCKTHGMSGTKIYICWKSIQSRCNKKNNPSYKNYGKRGIKCLWKTFEQFYIDMGQPPSMSHSIERINNNGNYCKKNCKWATKQEQAINRRTAHLITYKNKTKNMKTWAIELNIPYKTLWYRISSGWPIEKAFLSYNH